MAQKLFFKNVTLQSEAIPNNRQVVVTLQEIKSMIAMCKLVLFV